MPVVVWQLCRIFGEWLGILRTTFVRRIKILSRLVLSGLEKGAMQNVYGIPRWIIVLVILRLCVIVVGDSSTLHLFSIFDVLVTCFCICHFKVGISWMPRYVCGSFCVRTGNWLPLHMMMQDACRHALKIQVGGGRRDEIYLGTQSRHIQIG